MPTVDVAVPWARPVFTVADATYAWGDVAAFARRHGGWQQLVREVHEGVACRRAGRVPSPEAVHREATEFRYRHRLVTGEETEAWLQRRAVDVGQWMDHVRRTVLRSEHAGELAALVATHPLPHEEADLLVWVTGRCGGTLDAWARALAERAAAHVRLAGVAPTTDEEVDGALDRFRAAFVTAASLAQAVEHRRLDWLRVDLEEARFDDQAAAREAALCVRADGLSLAEACALAGAPPARRTVLLEELDGPLRTAVLGGAEGDLLGPVHAGDTFVLARVEAKAVPTLEDPEVHQRAVAATLATAVRHEVEERVRWHEHA